jgi:CRP-like cAMP-binding protein
MRGSGITGRHPAHSAEEECDMPATQRHDRASVAHWPVLVLPRGERMTPDAPGLFYVVDGRVRYHQVTDSGHEASVGVLRGGDAFVYHRQWLPGSPDAMIEAVEDTRLLFLRERDLPAFVNQNPDLASRVMIALVHRAGDVVEMACDLALVDARRRIVRALIRLADRHGEADPAGEFCRIVIPLKHQDVAALVGACRETVTSVLSDLARRGIVRTGRCTIAIHRQRALDLLEDEVRQQTAG